MKRAVMSRRLVRAGMIAALCAWVGMQTGCARRADVWLEGRTLAAFARGSADDASPGHPPAEYAIGDGDLWAADSLTSAYSEAPRAGRLAGGVAAEPVDTATGARIGYATARSLNRVEFPMEVRKAGRVQLRIELALTDVEIGGTGLPRAEVSAAILDEGGAPVPGGEIGALTLQIRPDGAVILDQFPDETEALQPNGRYRRVIEGPLGGTRLARGRYRVRLDLGLEATAASASGPYQLARIGQAIATVNAP